MHADLYDYDGTICPGDTETAFWLYCLPRRPYILLFAPIQLVGLICYFLRVDNKFTKYVNIYCFMRAVNGEKLAKRFAQKRIRKTYPYFAKRDRTRPVVVCSASPEFLLRPICGALGVEHVIGTQVDPRTGVVHSKICKRAEKVRRLREQLPDVTYENVYSDSLRHDVHIFRLGQNAYQVVHGEPREIDPPRISHNFTV